MTTRNEIQTALRSNNVSAETARKETFPALVLIDRIRNLSASAPRQAGHKSVTALAAAWLRAYDELGAAMNQVDEAGHAAWRLHPSRPSQFASEASLARWQEQCAAINLAFGVPALEERQKAAEEHLDDLARRIASTRPTTSTESALKLAIMLNFEGVHLLEDGSGFVKLVDDVARLAA